MERKAYVAHFRNMYPNWLKQTIMICAKRNMKTEAEDILHEVLLYLLKNKEDVLDELCKKQEKKFKALDCFVISITKRYVYSLTAPYYQNYHKNNPPIDQNIDLNNLHIPDDTDEASPLEEIENILNRLPLPEINRQIFYFHYFEHHTYSEWPGPQSISTQSRICDKILRLLQKELL